VNETKLGRNIDELIEENSVEIDELEKITDVKIALIRPNPDQPRTVFDEKSLKELSDSIREHGVIQPVILKPTVGGYILVAGERRVKACLLAGLDSVPAIIREYNLIYLSELSILENLQREDLTPIEEAIAFQKAIYNLKLTHDELGKKIGKSRVYVTNILGLLKLPSGVIDDVNRGVISMGHARALSKLKDKYLCSKLHQRILNENLTVRDIEKIIKDLSIGKTKASISKEILDSAQMTLEEIIDSSIRFKIMKDKILFDFSNEEELVNIINYLSRRQR